MFKFLRPHATTEVLLERGTDLKVMGRFKDTLDFNHFSEGDYRRLQEVAHLLADSLHEARTFLLDYFRELKDSHAVEITESMVQQFFETFFYAQRDDYYVDKVLRFYYELRQRKYNVGKLIVVFNQLNFYFMTKLLSKKALSPNVCLKLMETLQKAMNIEQQLLNEVFTEKLLEEAAEGISGLMDKNDEVMFIRELIKKMERQTAEAQNITAATEELTASIDSVAEHASHVVECTIEAANKAGQGREVISDSLEEIVHTDKTFDKMVADFEQLQNYISTIQDVVKLIHGIAAQTNLLALNASIEAARAGEQGRGFSVVASEVRKLAENTVSSLQQVNENMEGLETFSRGVSKTIEETSAIIKNSVEQAGGSVPILADIVSEVNTVHEAINITASSAEQQSASVEEINNRMVAITSLSEEVTNLGQDAVEAVYGLSKFTESFRNKIFSNNITLSTRALLFLSRTDHILWKWRIYHMLHGLETVKPEDVTSHEHCRLGKWYFDEKTKQRIGHYESYRQMDVPHKAVHDHAREAARAYASHDFAEAERQLRLLEKNSEAVLACIDETIRLLQLEKQ
ncbi:MAG TPA: chemoreceptor protein [Bacilli bacterium]|nr:chemoreceptor protein [Bacilli bacterium]